MLTDPCIFVSCDYCGEEDEVPLTTCGGGTYDERSVATTILAWGWKIEERGYHVCPDCVERLANAE